ncbi:hypothetical protein DF043_05730 [Burkholderia cepacia]|uniref:Fic family protein n=1 Tax=Burkholderia cepacia TaxID=292 RepID=UPI000F5B772A|nr:Fic family protein [Burkholderia cepacia]RQT65784.1 hypothetical protein DF043_05730 [Burkholderia cepacia]
MDAEDCNKWDYEKHPDQACVADRCRQILIHLRTAKIDHAQRLTDSRTQHFELFNGLTPTECTYLAGHYRGEAFPCLRYYDVGVGSDNRVGTASAHVTADIDLLSQQIMAILTAVDVAHTAPIAHISAEDRLLYVTEFAALVLVEFLRIHPYANGNGHIGRLLVWTILGRYGFWPKAWPLDDRPPPPYVECIVAYRNGNKEPLVQFMLRAIIGPPANSPQIAQTA